jgi:hypothetical protein
MRLRRSGADPRGREDAAAAAATAVVLEPTRRELYVVALHQAVPFVGFGIMDNSILILAGEAIDINLGATLGISTMCAAAIGNIGADLVRKWATRAARPRREHAPLLFFRRCPASAANKSMSLLSFLSPPPTPLTHPPTAPSSSAESHSARYSPHG